MKRPRTRLTDYGSRRLRKGQKAGALAAPKDATGIALTVATCRFGGRKIFAYAQLNAKTGHLFVLSNPMPTAGRLHWAAQRIR